MKLDKLIENLNHIKVKNYDNLEISNVKYDSRKVKKGDLFVCIKGYKTDGHKYIKNAVSNGALAAVVEEFKDVNIIQIKVKNSRKALATLGSLINNKPSEKLKMIGITATNGKTTTSCMLDSIFQTAKIKTGVIGTVAIKNGEKVEKAKLTTPESLDLQTYLRKMKDNDVEIVTMEVSSAGLKLDRVYNVDYDIAALNNLTKEHMDFHDSLDDYRNSKKKLIRNLKKSAWAVLNADDSQSISLKKEIDCNVLTYGIDNTKDADIVAKNLEMDTKKGKFKLVINKKIKNIDAGEYNIELSIPGYHSFYNALSVISIAIINGINIELIKKGIKKFTGVERKFELIYDKKFKIYDDSFTNKSSIETTLKTLCMMEYKKVILVYAIRGSRGVITNKENAETIVNWSKKLGLDEIIITTSNQTVEEKDKVKKEELNIFNEVIDKSSLDVTLKSNISDAVDLALNKTNEGDIILLAGCQGMNCGGHIILNKIAKNSENKEEILAPLKNRMLGREYKKKITEN